MTGVLIGILSVVLVAAAVGVVYGLYYVRAQKTKNARHKAYLEAMVRLETRAIEAANKQDSFEQFVVKQEFEKLHAAYTSGKDIK